VFATAALSSVAAMALFVVSAGAIVNGSPSNFESNDGNMTVETAGNTDWNCFANSNSSGFASGITVGQTCATGLNFKEAAARPADGSGEVQLNNGSKFDDQCPGLSIGNNPPKDEFQATAEFSDVNQSTQDTYFYGASIRPTTNGNSSGNLELNQVAGNGTTQHGCRSSGDRLIAYDFVGGGSTLSFHVLTYITSLTDTSGGNNTGGTTGCFVKSSSPPCWGAKVITPDSTEFEGGVNTGVAPTPTGAIPANQNGINGQALKAFAFNEMGVNLTKVLGLTGKCFAFPQQVWESRSSGSSFTSNPQDLEFQSVQIANCGEIVVQKRTDPRGGNKAFTINSNIAGSQLSAGTGSGVTGAACAEAGASYPGHYTLNDNLNTTSDSAGNTNDCANVPQGPYTISEGAEPGGYTFESLTCTADSGSGSSVNTSGETASISLKPEGLVTCVYVNKLNTTTQSTQESTGGTAVPPGTAVHDTATIVGSNANDTPSGSVEFFMCGPNTTAAASVCSSGGKDIGSGALSGSGATATATSPDVNTGGGLSPGFYCFRMEWPGDQNYSIPVKEWGGTNGTNECFQVLQIPTTTESTPSPGSGKTTLFGSTVTDHAVVTATTSGDDYPSGTVTFHICDPTQLTSGACPSGGTQVGSAVTDVASNPQTTPPSATADSTGFVVNKTGTWCFRADYTPGPPNGAFYTGSSDGSSGECFTVTDTTAASSAQSWIPNDMASVSSVNGAPLTGTLKVQLYNGTGCVTGHEVSGHTYTKDADGTSNTVSLTTSNSDVFLSDVSWLVSFASLDPNVSNPTAHCESSTLTVTN
jgi:hypothetical protein